MSVREEQSGEDWVWVSYDRSNAAGRVEALRIDGNTGQVKFGVRQAAYTQTYATAARVVPNATTVQMTDSTGGSVTTTLAAGITDAVAKNAIASINAQLNLQAADDIAIKKVLNSLINDLRIAGIVA